MRGWNGLYERSDKAVVEAKCRLSIHLKSLFPDYAFNKDFLYGKSGQALMKRFSANPYRIVRAGKARFAKEMRTDVPRIRQATIDHLFSQARGAVQHGLPARQHQLMEFRLLQSWQDYQTHLQRKNAARQQLEELYLEARQGDPKLPEAEQGVISTFHLARIIAETGPLSDFSSLRKLTRYAGLNLREKQSGNYRGKTRLSKKGRGTLRKILSQIVFPLVKRNALFGPYYHGKKEREGMPGSKALVAVMRKFLKLIYGWYQSGGDFDRQRVFACESQYRNRG